MNRSDILNGLREGTIRIYDLEKLVPKKEAVDIRAEFLEGITSSDLKNIRSYTFDPETVRGNIENMVGAVQVPIGIAGPVIIRGNYFNGKAFIPLATTEGALVASVNRGCKAINESGGARTRIIKTGQTRAPLFETESKDVAKNLTEYVEINFDALKKVAEAESRHLRLLQIMPYTYENLVWLRMIADTGDAMGMNMISIAAQNVGVYLEQNVKGIRYLSTSGNLCVDKKPSALTLNEGRGRYIIAETLLTEKALREILRTTSPEMEKLNLYKNILSAKITGSYGENMHFANIIAATYLATGQDLGHVVEGSHGKTRMEAKGEDLYVTVTIPAIQVGTIGGGTKLPCQRECIKLTGIKESTISGANASQLAEIIATAVLSGEISGLAAYETHEMVHAHKRLNR